MNLRFVRTALLWALPRRLRPMRYLERLAYRRVGGVVQGGPFRGMRYICESFGSTLVPKLLGGYERPIQPWIEACLAREFRSVLVLGAAEGYYAVGLAVRDPKITAIAFEQDPAARRALHRLAAANHVAERIDIRGQCLVADLGAVLDEDLNPPSLVVCDVEGAEISLLDPFRVPGLRHCTCLVELHGHVVPDIRGIVTKRFESSHTVEIIRETSLDFPPYPFRSFWTPLFPAQFKNRAMTEQRPTLAEWMLLTPRFTQSPQPAPPSQHVSL